jgi:putative transposase
LERVNAEIKLRTRVVGVFPYDVSALRLIMTGYFEQNDEWITSEWRCLSERTMALLAKSKIDESLEAGPPNLMA